MRQKLALLCLQYTASSAVRVQGFLVVHCMNVSGRPLQSFCLENEKHSLSFNEIVATLLHVSLIRVKIINIVEGTVYSEHCII